MVIAAQHEIDHLAARIESAYLRRGPRWDASRSTPRVWEAAAQALLQCRIEDPEVPVDPELFVAAQRIDPDAPNPWSDLACAEAGERYRRRIRTIVRQLRSELNREIRLAERMVSLGRSLGEVLGGCDPRLSPLSRYIVARRASRRDLASLWNEEALAQHQSCPLYRNASVGLLSVDDYPTDRDAAFATAPQSTSRATSRA